MGGVAWTQQEDELLKKCIDKYGEGKWHRIPLLAGLNRCRKSCRLRWLNYLRPNIKRGSFSDEEVDIIIKLHSLVGNRWSLIASRLPGRTANDVKNYWNCHLSRKLNISRNKNENSSARNEQATMPEQHHTPDTTEVQSCDHQEAPSCYNVQIQDQSNAANSIREEIEIDKTGQMFDGDNHVYDGKFDVEDPGVLMDILSTEFGFHGEIKVSEDAESSACYKWDMEDLIFGMDLWGDSTY